MAYPNWIDLLTHQAREAHKWPEGATAVVVVEPHLDPLVAPTRALGSQHLYYAPERLLWMGNSPETRVNTCGLSDS